jgi:hypothetical protein
MDEICEDDQWFEQAFTYMSQHDIPLANDKKLHVRARTCIIKTRDSF